MVVRNTIVLVGRGAGLVAWLRGSVPGPIDIRGFGQGLWNYRIGEGAAVAYAFDQTSVEVPNSTGPDSPRATWKLHATCASAPLTWTAPVRSGPRRATARPVVAHHDRPADSIRSTDFGVVSKPDDVSGVGIDPELDIDVEDGAGARAGGSSARPVEGMHLHAQLREVLLTGQLPRGRVARRSKRSNSSRPTPAASHSGDVIDMADVRQLPVPVSAIWDWQMRAGCRDVDSAVFFHPDRERGPARDRRDARAKRVCPAVR